MIGKLIGGLVGIFGATVLFWAGIAFEHRPVGFLSFHVWGPIGFKDPGGPAAQLKVLLVAERKAGAKAHAQDLAALALTQAVEIHDVETVTKIRTVTQTITKEIPVAITPATDRAFPLSVGFVRLHDAFARGVDLSQVPDPAGRPDDAASELASSAAVGLIGANYADCRVDRQHLADLQEWVRGVQRAFSTTGAAGGQVGNASK